MKTKKTLYREAEKLHREFGDHAEDLSEKYIYDEVIPEDDERKINIAEYYEDELWTVLKRAKELEHDKYQYWFELKLKELESLIDEAKSNKWW